MHLSGVSQGSAHQGRPSPMRSLKRIRKTLIDKAKGRAYIGGLGDPCRRILVPPDVFPHSLTDASRKEIYQLFLLPSRSICLVSFPKKVVPHGFTRANRACPHAREPPGCMVA